MNLVDKLKTYSQKSNMFLYPMLNISSSIKPLSTYMNIKDVSFPNPVLICLFYNKMNNYSQVKAHLLKNEFFEIFITENEYDYYVFNLSKMQEDYDLFKEGKYSKLSTLAKTKIRSMSISELTEIGINPEDYIDLYELELGVTFQEEREDLELLDPPHIENETLTLSKALVEEFCAVEF